MALETLKGVEEIGGYKVAAYDTESSHDDEHVVIDHDTNFLGFFIQDGPIKENGVNGCQVDTLIHAARHILVELNKKFPCKYNDVAITDLKFALQRLEDRTKDREARGVEGTSND